ncbi:MAG TPA: TetR/AcrR family transcriptional regulator [Thermoleophilaceae bacterium]
MSERRETTKRKLVKAAIEVIARDGFHAASVDAIARRAGFSIGALYSNFGAKDDLFFAVFDEHVAWFEERLAEGAAKDDRQAAVVEWMTLLDRQPQQFFVFVEFWAYAVRKPKLRARLAERLATMRARLAEVVGDDTAALVSLAAARGLAMERLADPDAVPDEVFTALAAAAPAHDTSG